MNINKNKKQAYSLLTIFIIFAGICFIFTPDKRLAYAIIGMASVLLILELGRLRENSRKLPILTIVLTVSFAVFGIEYLRYFSIAIFLALIPSFKIRRIKKINYKKFECNKNNLELKQKETIRAYKRAKIKVNKLEDDINSFSKLYELSKEIEQVISSEELAEKSLESLNLKINVTKLSFYYAASGGYRVLKTKNVTAKTANKWLQDINFPGKSSPDLFKFDLKKLGLIVCKGKLNDRQIREAEVLISQITLGYEKTTLYEKVKELSRIDGLTGLYLRMHFIERLTEEIKRAKRENYKVAFIMSDLDDFKKYNDTHGHPMGDKLLKEVADIIKNNIYSSDFAGRYGGEEFCIYMPMAEQEGTIKKLTKIWKLIERKTPISISMGVSYFPDNGSSPEELIKTADNALYQAKEKGKNQIYQINSAKYFKM